MGTILEGIKDAHRLKAKDPGSNVARLDQTRKRLGDSLDDAYSFFCERLSANAGEYSATASKKPEAARPHFDGDSDRRRDHAFDN